MKLSQQAKFWALGALGGVGLFALGVFAQQNGALNIDTSEQDLFSDLKAVFFLERKNNDEIDSIVRLSLSGGTVISAPTSELVGGEAKNTLQNNASIIGSVDSTNTSSGAFLIAVDHGSVEGNSMQSFIGGASDTKLKGSNAIAVATNATNLNGDSTMAIATKNTTLAAKNAVAVAGENINVTGQDSIALGSKIKLGANGALAFNAKNSELNLTSASDYTMVVSADNGLIINTNTSANPNVQLTVNGAIKLGAVANQTNPVSPYISIKTRGNVTCVCGRVNNQNSALSKYTRGNKQAADICQKVCDDQNVVLPAQCGAAATNYPMTQTNWSSDDFCQGGLGYAGNKPTFPALGGQTTWTCEAFPSGGPTCTATRKGCGDGVKVAGEQCDLGANNGKPDSTCSMSCEIVKAPKCGANTKNYLGSDTAWAQPNGFCTDDSTLSGSTPSFWGNCNRCGLRGFPYCFDVSFDPNSPVCKANPDGDISGQKNWTCVNKNGKNLTCTATRQPPMVAGKCGTTLNSCTAGTLTNQTTISNGKRWECAGLHGGSSKTCSVCDTGYKYNTISNLCEIDCQNPIYRHTNGVTIKAAACAVAGQEYTFEGQKYYIATDKNDIKAKIAANTYPANRIVTTRVTELDNLFENNHTFNQDISNWDTSNVTKLNYTFRRAYAFNQNLNYWDTSKVTSMAGTFLQANAFNKPLNNWDTSNVTQMSDMFALAYAFNQNISNWNVSKVDSMWHMFNHAYAFNQPLTNWNTKNVTNMDSMFGSTRNFNQPLDHLDVSNVSTMVGIFNDSERFNQSLNAWAGKLRNNVNLTNAFRGAKAFNQPLDQWKIGTMQDSQLTTMFSGAIQFKTHQPYCNWPNWTAKKGYFVNMGLNACSATPSCPAGFTMSNGKCVQWKCQTSPASTTPAKCSGTYAKPTGTTYYAGKEFIGTKVCVTNENRQVPVSCCENPSAEGRPGCSASATRAIKDVTANGGYSRICSAVIGGSVNNLRCKAACEMNPEGHLDRCVSTQKYTTAQCSEFTSAAQCGQKTGCTRTPASSTPASTKAVCVDNQGRGLNESECASAGAKPSCSGSTPGSNPLAGQPGTVRFSVRCAEQEIKTVQIGNFIATGANISSDTQDTYSVDLPLVDGNDKTLTPSHPFLKRDEIMQENGSLGIVLSKIKITTYMPMCVNEENPGQYKRQDTFELQIPSSQMRVPDNLPIGGTYEIVLNCMKPGTIRNETKCTP